MYAILRESSERNANHTKERMMSQNEMKNAGYKMVQVAAVEKCFNATRRQNAINAYANAVHAHETVNATLVQLIALSVIENA